MHINAFFRFIPKPPLPISRRNKEKNSPSTARCTESNGHGSRESFIFYLVVGRKVGYLYSNSFITALNFHLEMLSYRDNASIVPYICFAMFAAWDGWVAIFRPAKRDVEDAVPYMWGLGSGKICNAQRRKVRRRRGRVTTPYRQGSTEICNFPHSKDLHAGRCKHRPLQIICSVCLDRQGFSAAG